MSIILFHEAKMSIISFREMEMKKIFFFREFERNSNTPHVCGAMNKIKVKKSALFIVDLKLTPNHHSVYQSGFPKSDWMR
jgi:hypothetical protein